ncbi:DUF7287 family protein [Archaeoglobus neptunius]|uniref:DUF7287 family protein n=1 Tax=Archaeoglobus neptunius TaxID=2798580 RepID=UPI001928F677|nr:hypothetical protein [Archaeoglobus neptunius]
MDREGKLSLDLLIGLSIFLFTFIFVANFLPGVFADVRHEISLGSNSYRVASLLVEDPGYPLDWEYRINTSNCNSKEFRPGLARFDTTTRYNNLNRTKVEKFFELIANNTCREETRKYLGLDLSNVSWEKYKFNVSLQNLSDAIVFQGGDKIPESGQIVMFERLVYLDNCTGLSCDLIADRCVCKLEVKVWI